MADELQPGPVGVRNEDRAYRRPEGGRGRSQDALEHGLEVAATGDRLDGGGERGAGIDGLPVCRHGTLLLGWLVGGRIVHPALRPGTGAPLTRVVCGIDTPRVKLVVAIVHSEDAGALVNALLDKEFRATRLHSSGGFLKQSNATIILGVEDADVDEVMGIVRANCTSRTQVVNPMPPIMEPGEFFMPYPLEVEVGGATVFVLPVERFERL